MSESLVTPKIPAMHDTVSIDLGQGTIIPNVRIVAIIITNADKRFYKVMVLSRTADNATKSIVLGDIPEYAIITE